MLLYIVNLIFLIILLWIFLPTTWGAPYIPSKIKSIKKALECLNLKSDQVVVDLGSGDGRVIILASLLYGCKSIGVEIDPIRQIMAQVMIYLLGLREISKVVEGNFYTFNISNADVVMFYILPTSIQRLQPKLKSQLRSGSKVVSFKFPIPNWNSMLIDKNHNFFIYSIDDQSTLL